MIKNFLIPLIAVILFSLPSSAGSPSVQRQARDGDTSVDFGMMNVDFNTSNGVGIYSLGLSYPIFSLDWSSGAAGFNAGLYVCDTPNGGGTSPLSGSSECVSVTTLQTTDLTVESFKSKKRYIVIDIISAGTGRLTIKGSWDQISGGSSEFIDADGNGLYESAYIWDADGDGSSAVVCTAKDSPDPACKVAGEIIYRDAADDINCAVHGCGFGQMELTGTLKGRPGYVYINWPCYDASEPAGFNDPTATNDDLHDSITDVAFQHCAPGPNFAQNGKRLHAIHLMGWQGHLLGAGVDKRDPLLTPGYKRDKGSYLIDDRGPSWEAGANLGNNNWFGQTSFIRGITFGYIAAQALPNGTTEASGEAAGGGDSKGFWQLSGTQLAKDFNGQICVSDSAPSTLGTLVAGDIVLITGSSDTTAPTSSFARAAVRVRNTPNLAATCNGAGTAYIELGGTITGGVSSRYAVEPQLIKVIDGAKTVVHARSDYLSAHAQMSNWTIASQDQWNDASGDCAATGGWNVTLDGNTNIFACDTEPFVGVYGGGSYQIHDLVINGWHQYAFDGASNPGNPFLSRVYFFRGNGGPTMDFGYGWNVRDVEIRDTLFESNAVSAFGPGVNVSGMKFYNVAALQLARMDGHNTFNLWENIEAYSSAFHHMFYVGCGARSNIFRGLKISGKISGAAAGQRNGSIAWFDCANTAEPIKNNSFTDVLVEGRGDGAGNTHNLILFGTNAVVGTSNSDAIIGNRFSGFNLDIDEDLLIHGCLFGAQDASTVARTTDFTYEEVLSKNSFFQNSSSNTSPGTDAKVFCGCGVYDAVGNGSSWDCDDLIRGTAAGGSDPRGCGNFENGAQPSFQSCS